jgi:hypothetical protein
MKKLIKRLLKEMNYVEDVNEVVLDEGVMGINGLIEWDDIEEMDEDECKEWIEDNILSDDEIDV